MKRVLITGAHSYVGESFEKYCNINHPNQFQIDTLDMHNSDWKEYDFSSYDSVLHVAGIVHRKETKKNASLYYSVNKDLAIEVACKAKESRVKHFVFMSTMSVYGLNHYKGYISKDTPCRPNTNYGKSKLQAEKEINKLVDESFRVAVVRPPMVYGDNCPGNLTKLFHIVRKVHIFPKIKNERSSISIEKLCNKLYSYISQERSGTFLPQNSQYMCTYKTVRKKMEKEEVYVLYLSIFNPIIRILIGKVEVITKAFGDLRYEK